MSSARPRTLPSLGRVLRGVIWTALFAVLAAGAAGLVGQAWHVPGGAARAELTYAGDVALNGRLDAAAPQLELVAAEVGDLATEAKTAISQLAATDPAPLQATLARGTAAADRIESLAATLRPALGDLPGAAPADAVRFSNGVLVRRAAFLAALDASSGLAAQWRLVTARIADTTELTGLISEHDATVLAAAADGRAGRYRRAAGVLDEAILRVADVTALRKKVIAGNDRTVLDEWIDRNAGYDAALQALYRTLDASGGIVTDAVQAARIAERAAFDQLPPDRRTILVIISEVARGGLTQAVLAIEDASGRIDDALAEAGLPGASPSLAPEPEPTELSPTPAGSAPAPTPAAPGGSPGVTPPDA